MSKKQLDEFFDEYVFGAMFTDIEREIKWGRANFRGESDEGGGNFLAALGLLCYTEALGKLMLANPPHVGSGPFEAFFDTLGGGRYGEWRVDWEKASRLHVSRCLPKRDGTRVPPQEEGSGPHAR
jgi:hypothetical protein